VVTRLKMVKGDRNMKTKLIERYIGKPIQLVRGSFALNGYIAELDGDTVLFITQEKEGLIAVGDITQITEYAREFWMEICMCCGKVWKMKHSIRDSSCPYCKCEGKEK